MICELCWWSSYDWNFDFSLTFFTLCHLLYVSKKQNHQHGWIPLETGRKYVVLSDGVNITVSDLAFDLKYFLKANILTEDCKYVSKALTSHTQ